MNNFTKKDLLSVIKNISKFSELKNNDDASFIISEYGGRPLGLFPKKDCYSLLWINPNIKETIENRERDIGGDRYWISPERDYFYKDPEN